MKVLYVDPLEPLVLSGSPVLSHEFIVGYHRVLGVPAPTTIAGLLGVIMGVTAGTGYDAMESLDKLVENLEGRGCKDVIIKGPLVSFKELTVNEPYVYLGRFLVPMSRVKVSSDGIPFVDLSDCSECVEFNVKRRVGIKLVRGYSGDEKVVDRGYMYSYSIALYKTFDGRTVTPTYMYAVNCKSGVEGVYRVGGEGRLARVSLKDVTPQMKVYVERLLSPLELSDNHELLVTLTPIPLIPRQGQLQLDPNTVGLEFVDEVIGLIPTAKSLDEVTRAKLNLKRKVERLNLGYSEVAQARRPQLLALPTGTIIRTRKPQYVPQPTRTLWRIGYATLLKPSVRH